MSRLFWIPVVMLLTVVASPLWGAEPPAVPVFGQLQGLTLEQAKAKSLAWLRDEAKADAATLMRADAFWIADEDRPLLDRVAETLMLGSPEAARLINEIRDHTKPLPAEVPALLKESKNNFFRANLCLYYAKQLVVRRIHDEALEALKLTKAEDVADPAAYYFFKAVAANKLLRKQESIEAIDRLMNSVADVPERYSVLATLMKFDMATWKDQDLGHVSRRMEEVEGRLDNARGGKQTQDKQKEIIDLLAKMIEEMEKQQQQQSSSSSSGGNSNNAQRSTSPLPDSKIMGGAGEGNIDPKKLLSDPKLWGNLPEKDRIKALEAISRDYPPHVREAVEGYLREIEKARSQR